MSTITAINSACAITGFDYSAITTDAAELAKRTAHKIQAHQRCTSTEIIDIGTDLILVKAALKHGKFGEWLRVEFRWDERTAQRYMHAAITFGSKSDIVSVLPQTIMYLLSAPSTPKAIADNVISKLEHGEPVDLDVVEGDIQTARHVAKQERLQRWRLKSRQASAQTRKRQERERLQAEAGQEERRTRADAIARELITEFGLGTVERVLEAADDWEVLRALREIIEAAPTTPAAMTPATTRPEVALRRPP
jgi:hypothetical protein